MKASLTPCAAQPSKVIYQRYYPAARILVFKIQVAGSFKAGQYAEIYCESTKCSYLYSIANNPINNILEFHIKIGVKDSFSAQLAQQIIETKQIKIINFGGRALYKNPQAKPVVCIAGGAGFAYSKAIIEAALASTKKNPIILIWGVQDITQCYFLDELKSWQVTHDFFDYHIITGPLAVNDINKINRNILENADIYLSGPGTMCQFISDILPAGVNFTSDFTKY